MSHAMTRRHFLQGAAALAVGVTGVASARDDVKRPPSERLNLGIVGVNGQGGYNLGNVAGENIVALCDVDTNRAEPARKKHPKAKFYQDYRRMLDQKGIDAVVISIPDHMHAFVAMAAMRAGKHVYCEKPLAHSVHEVRTMMATAAKNGIITQMGTQIHAGDNYRRVVELVQSGAIGTVDRVQVWCERRPDAGTRAKEETQPPTGLNYDLWLGPAPYRPYHKSHLHFVWRWWWDFGGGVLADMGCHFMDLAHWALNLRSPVTIAAEGHVLHKGDNDMPDTMRVDYKYPAKDAQPAVHLTWYHGFPGPDLTGKKQYKGYSSGVLFEGDKGSLVANYSNHQLLPEEKYKDFVPPKPSIPASIGHHKEWLEAIKHGGKTTCNFDYSGALAEAVLLGNVAYRCGKEIAWDAAAGKASNAPEAEQFLRREYRKGWDL